MPTECQRYAGLIDEGRAKLGEKLAAAFER